MKKINNLSLPITITTASLILGGFFYATQVNKQRSIEKQQEVKIEQEPKTQVIIYTPKFDNYLQKEGECWSVSTALQGRPGSLRCSVDNGIIDPCFRVDEKIICDTNPLEEGNEFELILKEGDKFGILDNNDVAENNTKLDKNKRFSWIYQLEDGSRCSLIQGTSTTITTGEEYYYTCDGNKVIIGDVDKSSDLWKANVGHLVNDSHNELKKRETQSIIKAWE